MTALIAVLIFPVLTLLLVALTKAENMLGSLAVEPSDPSVASVDDPAPAALRVVQELDALPVPRPQLRLVEAPEDLAA